MFCAALCGGALFGGADGEEGFGVDVFEGGGGRGEGEEVAHFLDWVWRVGVEFADLWYGT